MDNQLGALITFWLFVVISGGYIYIKEGSKRVTFIKKYVRENDKWVTRIVEGTYNDINHVNFTWKFIPEISTQGWVQDRIPPEPPTPCVIASKGMLKIADEILSNKE